MKCSIYSLFLLLSTFCVAHFSVAQKATIPIKPAVSTKPAAVPEIPTEFQLKFQKLVIEQVRIELDEKRLQDAYAADQASLNQINAEGRAEEATCLKQLKLDPAKYTVQYKDGKMQVVPKTESK